MAGRRSYNEFCEVMKNAKCDKCSGTLKKVNGDKKDSQPLVYWCEKCDEYSGLDDTYSESTCHQVIIAIKDALEYGVLRAEMCPGCGNDNIDLFIFEDDDDQRLSLRCMVCRHLKVLADTRDDTADNQPEPADDQFPIVCVCGNDNPDIFSVIGSYDEEATLFQCLVCDEKTPICLNKATNVSPQKAKVSHKHDEGYVRDPHYSDHVTSEQPKLSLAANRTTAQSFHIAEEFAEVADGMLNRVCKLRREDYVKIGLVGVEGFNVLSDLTEGHKQKKAGIISRHEFQHLVVDSVVTGIGKVAGSLMLPGNMVLGHRLGAVVGRMLGQAINKLIDNN